MIDTIRHPRTGETYAVAVSENRIVEAAGPMRRPYDDPSAWISHTPFDEAKATGVWLQAELDAFDASLPPSIGVDPFGEPPAEVVS